MKTDKSKEYFIMDLVQYLQNILDQAVESGEECGCQLTVYQNGKLVCDLAAGFTDPGKQQKVSPDTLFPIFSVGKGIMSVLMHILENRGLFSFDDEVRKYWPEYACRGKEETRIRDIMTHKAGLADVPAPLAFHDWFDWQKISAVLAEAAPQNPVGGTHRYHAHTFGVLTGVLAERITGKNLHRLLQDEIFSPLHISRCFFGLPEKEFANLAPIDGSVYYDSRVDINHPAVLGGLNPSSNGCSNARSIAKIYASLTGDGLNGIRLLDDAAVEKAVTPSETFTENDISRWDKFGLGFALCGPSLTDVSRIFGHGGAAGAEGFADRKTGYAVGFTKNRLNSTHPDHPVRHRISRALGLHEWCW